MSKNIQLESSEEEMNIKLLDSEGRHVVSLTLRETDHCNTCELDIAPADGGFSRLYVQTI